MYILRLTAAAVLSIFGITAQTAYAGKPLPQTEVCGKLDQTRASG
jgi:hypothetical protein